MTTELQQNENLGVYGAKRQTWSGDGPRAALLRLTRTHPDASAEDLAKFLLDEVREDETLLLPILVYWTQRNLLSLREPPAPTPAPKTQKAAQTRQTAKLVRRAKVRIAVIFLSMEMPNGKTLGECTGAECKKFGGFYSKVAEKIGARERVAAKLTEKDLLSLWKQSNR